MSQENVEVVRNAFAAFDLHGATSDPSGQPRAAR
jgi:hypothetical protein